MPKRQLNVGATQEFPVGSGVLAVTGSWAYVSSQVFNAVRAADQQSAAVKAQYATENSLGRISRYGLFNGRIAYKLEDRGVEFALYGRNITNKKYLVRRFSDLYRQLGIVADYSGYPGTYGLEITASF